MEELDLPLNQEEAASLYLLLETAIDTLKSKGNILKEIQTLDEKDRPEEVKDSANLQEVINLNKTLMESGLQFRKDVGQLIVELDKPKGPIIIPKPNFRAKQ